MDYYYFSETKIKTFARTYSDKCIAVSQKPNIQYAVVLDAGSTGSRVHIYRYNYCQIVPVLEDEIFHQLKPGLSSYSDNPENAPHSLVPLMNLVMENIPRSLHSSTPLTLKATAGLRLLKDENGEKILKFVRSYLEKFPFRLNSNSVEIMDGKDEGVFAWITVNYLLDNFHPTITKKTAAIMDLGGGSTQIVFQPNTEIPPGSHRVEVPFLNKNYILYQKSYDGYGLMQARKKTLDKGGCKGLAAPVCLNNIASIFDKESTCSLSPCSFNGVFMPKLEDVFYEGDIYAFSYFYDIYAEPFGKVESGFKVGHLYKAAKEACSEKVDTESCLDLGFIYSLLKIGYELPQSRDLKTAKKINGIETGWCLGAALAMINEIKNQ